MKEKFVSLTIISKSRLKTLIIFGLSFFFGFLSSPRAVYAAGTIYFTPSGGSYPVGSTLKVSVRLDTGGEAVNAVSAYFTYPTEFLDFAWISESGSLITVWAEKQGGGGTVKLAGGLPTPGFSGRGLVATIGFKVKKVGQAAFSFVSGSHVLKDNDNSDILSLGGSDGATFSFVIPEPTQLQPTPTPVDEAPPVISEIEVNSVTESSAVISWKTDEEADSLIEFGIEPDQYLMTTSQGAKTNKDHEITLKGLSANTTFYFRVVSQDASGNTSRSDGQGFGTLPLPTPTLIPITPLNQKLRVWLAVISLFLISLGIFLLLAKQTNWVGNLLKKLRGVLKRRENDDYQEGSPTGGP